MYKELLRSIPGIEIFPVISLCLFLAIFGVSVIHALRLDKARVARWSRLPLEDQPSDAKQKEGTL